MSTLEKIQAARADLEAIKERTPFQTVALGAIRTAEDNLLFHAATAALIGAGTASSPTPNPQSQIPNPQSPIPETEKEKEKAKETPTLTRAKS